MDVGENPADDPWWHPGDDDGSNVGMFDGHYSTEDLFELVWQAGGDGRATGKPALSCTRSSPSAAASPPSLPSGRISVEPPPSEDVMAAWLYQVVIGQDLDGGCPKQPTAKAASETATMAMRSQGSPTAKSKGKLVETDGMSGAKDTNTRRDSGKKKKAYGGSSGRKGSSHQSATHNSAEKRRRCKITERLRTLQQLVPGCEKSNQASTLEQTIQYMKSLQQQLQAMQTSPSLPPVGYPFAMPMPPTVAAVAPGTVLPPAGMVPMVQFGTMLPYPHYMLPTAAAAPPSCYPRAPGASAAAPVVTGDHAQCSVSLEQRQRQNEQEKGRRRL